MPKVKHSKYYRNWKLSVLYRRPFHPINNYTVQSKILEFFPMMGVKCWWKPLFSKRNGLICLYSSRFLSVFHKLIISFFLEIFSWFLLTIHFVIYYLPYLKFLGFGLMYSWKNFHSIILHQVISTVVMALNTIYMMRPNLYFQLRSLLLCPRPISTP